MAKKGTSKSGNITDLHLEFSWYGDYCLTKKGSLIGAIELQGRDADGLIDLDGAGRAGRAKGGEGDREREGGESQYFAHFDGAEVSLKPRSHPVCDLLSSRRERFLNSKRLSSTKLVFCFEIMPNVQLSKLDTLSLFKHIGKSIYSADSREAVYRHFSKVKSIVCYLEELAAQAQRLSDYLKDITDDWEGLVNPRVMSRHELWGFFKFVSNLDPHYLSDGYETTVPESGLDSALPDGDRCLVDIKNVDAVKLCGSEAAYARVLSVNNFSARDIPYGLWSNNKATPARQTGNYLLMLRYQPYSQAQKSFLFKRKEMDLNRRNIDLIRAVMGKEKGQSEKDRRELMKPAIKEALKDLGEAEMLDVGWGLSHSLIAVWDTDPVTLNNQGIKIKRACDRAGLQTCWENIGLSRAFKSMMPGGRHYSLRDIPINTMQLGAASLLYAPSQGQHVVPDLPGEECQYVFTSVDGTPFHFSPFVNERCVVIGIGPIRSGKSFTKVTLASHFLKYGGSIHGIDIDQGMEPLAQVFGKDGGIFRTEDAEDKGFNPFVSCRGPNDMAFANHLTQMVIQMLKQNDTEENQAITADEQYSLDKAIRDTMRMEKELQTFNNVWRHCSRSLQRKLSRWVVDPKEGAGTYAHYFDSKEDAIGSADDKRVMAYNLRSLKDDPRILPLVMAELFFRTVRHFEDVESLDVPNYLDVDEFHALSGFDYILDTLIKSVRTWGKYKAGVGLWSQSAKDFAELDHWAALRSAASTFFFMADPNMDEVLYQRTFLLSAGECEAIRTLKPKREAFIVQRDLGIAKKVILEVEPEQHVVSTSRATETTVRRRNFDLYPDVQEAITRTAEEIGLLDVSNVISFKERVA